MDTNNDSQPSDFGQGSVALKVMLPERLHNDLNLFAHHIGKSKTEIVRDAVFALMDNTQIWKSKCYFFKPKDGNKNFTKSELLTKLTSAPKGTLIKLAGLPVDAPDRANILICNLIRVKGNMVSFEIPNNYRPTPLNTNQQQDSENVSMASGLLVLPLIDMVPSTFSGEIQRLIYTVDIDYVWDIDTSAPSFF